LKAEQNLTEAGIAWLLMIAKAILRAFSWDEGQPMRTLADALGVSPTTLYTTLCLAVQALMLVRRGKSWCSSCRAAAQCAKSWSTGLGCTFRSDTCKVIQGFAEAGFKEKIRLCLTDMYAGYLEPVKTFLPKAVHQSPRSFRTEPPGR